MESHHFPDHVDPTRPAEKQRTPIPYTDDHFANCKFCDEAIYPGTIRMAIPYRWRGEPRFCYYHDECFYQLPESEIEEKLSSGLVTVELVNPIQTNHSPFTMASHHFPVHVDPTRPAEKQRTPFPCTYHHFANCKFCYEAIYPGTIRMAIPYRWRGEPRFCYYHYKCFYQLPESEIEEKLSSGLVKLA